VARPVVKALKEELQAAEITALAEVMALLVVKKVKAVLRVVEAMAFLVVKKVLLVSTSAVAMTLVVVMMEVVRVLEARAVVVGN